MNFYKTIKISLCIAISALSLGISAHAMETNYMSSQPISQPIANIYYQYVSNINLFKDLNCKDQRTFEELFKVSAYSTTDNIIYKYYHAFKVLDLTEEEKGLMNELFVKEFIRSRNFERSYRHALINTINKVFGKSFSKRFAKTYDEEMVTYKDIISATLYSRLVHMDLDDIFLSRDYVEIFNKELAATGNSTFASLYAWIYMKEYSDLDRSHIDEIERLRAIYSDPDVFIAERTKAKKEILARNELQLRAKAHFYVNKIEQGKSHSYMHMYITKIDQGKNETDADELAKTYSSPTFVRCLRNNI